MPDTRSRSVATTFRRLLRAATGRRLTDLDNDLDYDVVVTGDDEDARQEIKTLAEEIEGIRALVGGPLAVSGEIEAITPLLINLAMNNDGMHDLGVKFQ